MYIFHDVKIFAGTQRHLAAYYTVVSIQSNVCIRSDLTFHIRETRDIDIRPLSSSACRHTRGSLRFSTEFLFGNATLSLARSLAPLAREAPFSRSILSLSRVPFPIATRYPQIGQIGGSHNFNRAERSLNPKRAEGSAASGEARRGFHTSRMCADRSDWNRNNIVFFFPFVVVFSERPRKLELYFLRTARARSAKRARAAFGSMLGVGGSWGRGGEGRDGGSVYTKVYGSSTEVHGTRRRVGKCASLLSRGDRVT